MQPEIVLLAAAAAPLAAAAFPIGLAHRAGVDRRQAEDGWHGLWRMAEIAFQFWTLDAPAAAATTYAVTLPFDALFELRAHAARRLWRTVAGRTPGEPFRVMPTQLRRLHTSRLRALDGRQAGASYREIAEVLLGFRGTKSDFESDPRKNQARRLAADASQLMRGGYRVLLHYPIKLERREAQHSAPGPA